jgi:hypothetical protein
VLIRVRVQRPLAINFPFPPFFTETIPMNPSLSVPAFLGCAIYFLSGCQVTDHSKKDPGKENRLEPFDVIIVPGVPYDDENWALVFKARMLWAKYLFDKKITKNIIFSGSAVYSPFVEGKIMRIYADSMRIPSQHTFAETQAEHSTENLHYSVKLAIKHGFHRIALATDQYQALMLKHFVKKNYPQVTILPIRYSKIDLVTAPWPAIDPSPAYVRNFVSIVKREKRMERWKGTIGMNISPELRERRKKKYAVF